ncbi:unnamed protein product [Cuscuta campestris]|uniref:Uncharacterized protein n=1 Tax=Cuscuta campestris TaxID=132261 RepID=A0A484LA61_9ASTE|nr:unnamed protein product [Cuscuta campestris]
MVKASSIKQGDQTLEKVYSQLQAVWKEIDRRRPNPMKCPEDMTIFTQIQQQNRLYQFLQAINEEFDVEKRDILKTDPLPSVEEAYAQIRREATRKGIMKGDDGPSSGDVPSGLGSGFAATRARLRSEKEIGGLTAERGGRSCLGSLGQWWAIKRPPAPPPSKRLKTSPESPWDIQTGKIIGRGSERNGLYYVEEFDHYGTATLAHGTVDRQACPVLPPETVPTEEVSHSVRSSFENIEQSNNSELMSDSTPSEKTPEVSISPIPDDCIDKSNDTVEELNISNRYVLPPRKNRGIPPVRYELEYIPRNSRYPVADLVRGSVSQALHTSSHEVPRTVDEAIRIPE